MNKNKIIKKLSTLVELSTQGFKTNTGELDVDFEVTIEGETWKAYSASVSYRDILLSCDKGSVTYLVDGNGLDNWAVLHDFYRDGEN